MIRTIICIIAVTVLLYCIYKEVYDLFNEAVAERVKLSVQQLRNKQAQKLHDLKAENEHLRYQLQHIPIEIKAIGYNEEGLNWTDSSQN